MELQDFIKETLVQIASGVEEAQAELKENGSEAIINTNTTVIKNDRLVTGGQRKPVEYIEFDVAVLANEKIGSKAGVGISVASVFKAEVGGELASSHGSESRIKFRIPMSYPMNKYDENEG